MKTRLDQVKAEAATSEQNKTRKTQDITCIGRTVGRTFVQEFYETASRDAGRRSRWLRKQGFRASVSSMGSQVTPLGRVKMSMVTIHPKNLDNWWDWPTRPAKTLNL